MGRRIVIYGNAGSGKTTLAREMMRDGVLPLLALDDVTWAEVAVRRPLAETIAAVERFMASHDEWIIEGCYGDVVEACLPHCTELVFLNPGVATCVDHCRARPWEPDKYATADEQDRHLAVLIEWVRRYETRDDEFGLARHRAIFDGFTGPKREVRDPRVG